MSNPILSVITPIFNCEQYLEASLESVLQQSFKDFEFIIVNDGSTDSSVDIVRKYDDNRIRLVNNSDNKKIPTRRNEAVNMACGKYIAIHDGDDISLLDRFKKQVDILETKDLFCVGGFATRIDPDDEEQGIMNYPPEEHDAIVYAITHQCKNPIIDPTTMFKRDLFLQLGGYTLEKAIYTVPDFDLWLKAILKGWKFHNIQEPIIRYRTNPEGMTRKNKPEMIRAHMIVWRRFLSLFIGGQHVR